MMTFWLIAAAMIALSVACVTVPLLRRAAPLRDDHGLAVAIYRAQVDELGRELATRQLSADRHDDARSELERRLVDETVDSAASIPAARSDSALKRSLLAALLLAALPSAAVVLYMRLGDPAAIVVESGGSGQPAAHLAMQGSLDVVVSRLAARLRQAPDDADGWAMLARSYVVLDRADDAVIAYRRALALKPHDADLLADYADAVATLNGGDLNGEAMQSIDAALAVDPAHLKALALAASAAYDRQDYPLAIQYWERLKAAASPGSAIAGQATRNIEGIKNTPATLTSQRVPAMTTGVLEVHVRLNPALSARTRPGEAVFVYALATDGSRMPLAVQRMTVGQLPSTLRLDDSMAMTSGRRLSDFDQVIVEAHVSGSGSAQFARGDLIGKSAAVPKGREVVDVTISDVIR